MRTFLLKDIREDRDYSQLNIAKILNVSQSEYSRYEQGITEIPVDKLVVLANYYDLSVDYLVGITNDRIRHTKCKYDGHRIKELRLESNTKEVVLASSLGVTQAQYSRYESSINKVPLLKAIKLSDYYNVSLDYLLGLTSIKDKYSIKVIA